MTTVPGFLWQLAYEWWMERIWVWSAFGYWWWI